ncbi:hypothetical protein MASR2M29_13790 [Spirochaetota bacterium]
MLISSFAINPAVKTKNTIMKIIYASFLTLFKYYAPAIKVGIFTIAHISYIFKSGPQAGCKLDISWL